MAELNVSVSEHDMTKVKITGELEHNWIEINGNPIYAEDSRKIRDHSNDLSWGYNGSGPSQTALSVLLYFLPSQTALKLYHSFREEFVAKWRGDFSVEINLLNWVRNKIQSMK